MSTRIDGKELAEKLLFSLHEQVHKPHLKPHLEVILIGDNASSLSYIRQKQKAADSIGASLHITQLPSNILKEQLQQIIETFNQNHSVHGIIIQLPLPEDSTIPSTITQKIVKEKDVDGFTPDSPFQAPIAKAVITILEQIFYQSFDTPTLDLLTWLRSKEIVVVGKGETAGKPIRATLESMGLPIIGIDQSTPQPHELFKKADIIISCVGKPDTVKNEFIKEGAILLSVGLSQTEAGLSGDYNEELIKEKAGFYTPTPGGVGPVNVSCLMQNLVKASTIT